MKNLVFGFVILCSIWFHSVLHADATISSLEFSLETSDGAPVSGINVEYALSKETSYPCFEMDKYTGSPFPQLICSKHTLISQFTLVTDQLGKAFFAGQTIKNVAQRQLRVNAGIVHLRVSCPISAEERHVFKGGTSTQLVNIDTGVARCDFYAKNKSEVSNLPAKFRCRVELTNAELNDRIAEIFKNECN